MRTAFTCAMLLLPCALHAQQWSANGVITQGVFHTDENKIYGESKDDASFDFTEVSLNGSYRSPLNARLSAQVIYRHAGATFDKVNLDYLNLDTQLSASANHSAGIRVGRVKVPYGLFNESRDIAFTRPSIYLSQSIYFDVTMRETLVAGDGIFPYVSFFSDIGRWDIEIGYGKPKDVNFDTLQVLGTAGNYELNRTATYRVLYTSPNESVQIAFSGLHPDEVIYRETFPLSQFGLNPINFGGFRIDEIDLDVRFNGDFNVLSFMYAFKNYTFIAEYGRIKVETASLTVDGGLAFLPLVSQRLPEIVEGINTTSESIHAQIEKRFNRHWAIHLSVDHLYTDRDDREGDLIEELNLGRGYSRFARDTSLGIQWTPRWDISVRAEVHHIDGTAWLNDLENNNESGDSEQYWNAAALSFSYRF